MPKASIDNLSIGKKSLLVVVIMASMIIAMVGFGAVQLGGLGSKASEIIERRDAALAKMVRVGRLVTLLPYTVFATLSHGPGTPEGTAASHELSKSVSGAMLLLDEVGHLAPRKLHQLQQFRLRFETVAAHAQRAMSHARATAGWNRAGALSKSELDALADTALEVNAVDLEARSLVADIVRFNDTFLIENGQAADRLRAQASNSLLTLAAVGALSVLGAAAFSIWMSTTKIAGPLRRLENRMRLLASGDLSTDIPDQQRLDEVGAMSRAVQVFKETALQRLRLESDADEGRRLAAIEEARTRQEREGAAAEQTQVVSALAGALRGVAAGDLTVRLTATFPSSYEQIRSDFNHATTQLQSAMHQVLSCVEAIGEGAADISRANDNLSQRTEQQAVSLEKTAAALDEVTATVKTTARGAIQARDAVALTKGDAEQSGVVVLKAVTAMNTIADGSRQIDQIIGVIDEIAFQTSLLALNAGVEAARAGESGRGFAVVAHEVRALAQRSADAAKEIKALLSTSSEQVAGGVKLVGDAGDVLERIVTQVVDINSVAIEIAGSAQEQALALGQVNVAINQMDQTTQQNAAMVEETTAAGHALAAEVRQLSDLVHRFKLGAQTPSLIKPRAA